MKNYYFFILFMLFLAACNEGANKAGTNLDAGIEKKIDSIVAQMTLEEKSN